MKKKGKKRRKKTSMTELRQQWREKRSDPKKTRARGETIGAIALLVMFCFFCIGGFWLFFWLDWHHPIERADAVSRSVQYDNFVHYSGKFSTHNYLKLKNGEQIDLENPYITLDVKTALRDLPSGTVIDLKMREDGTVLEIKAGNREILNFDEAQRWLCQRAIWFYLILCGVGGGVGTLVCGMYVGRKVFKEKVFAKEKSYTFYEK